ncbi:hypothetical protein UP17_16280 [Peribacillus simplex]|uniref:hypothetical protein n=1 Tax=Peribacillus simplex TaxID=1478 RepID=UPI000777BC0F|nr:hypothetical protein [Peribacillus simplex]AMM93841.1 hypothetical protein UP17_16280 [Peribacillus simplex]
MALTLDKIIQIEDELKNILQKAQIALKDNKIEDGRKTLAEYKTCSMKLRKLLLDNGFGNSGYFDEFINVSVTDSVDGIEPLTSLNKIRKLKEQIEIDISYLNKNINYVQECIDTGLPINRDLNFEDKLSEVDYEKIIRDIYKYGIFMSGTRDSYKKLEEVDIRNLILNNMNSIYPNLIGTGETFNKGGRADIILKNKEKINVFIAECKLWKGPQKSIIEGLDQLLDNYIAEHDRKIALLIFNNKVKIETATKGIKKHVVPHLKTKRLSPMHIRTKFEDYTYYYLIKHPLDSTKTVELTIILININ